MENENILFYDDNTPVGKAIKEIKKMKNTDIYLSFSSRILASGGKDLILKILNYITVVIISAKVVEDDIYNILKIEGTEELSNFLKDIILSLNKNFITPSELLSAIGKKLNNKKSILYECYKNNIEVYCPAITENYIGNALLNIKVVIDVVADIRKLNIGAMKRKITSGIILSVGILKHHLLNANLFKNGLDNAVIINTAIEKDGCDAGAEVEEAVTWGKIKANTTSLKIRCDPIIILPILFYYGFKDF